MDGEGDVPLVGGQGELGGAAGEGARLLGVGLVVGVGLNGQAAGRDMRVAVELPSTSDAMLGMLIGEYWLRRSTEMVESAEKAQP